MSTKPRYQTRDEALRFANLRAELSRAMGTRRVWDERIVHVDGRRGYQVRTPTIIKNVRVVDTATLAREACVLAGALAGTCDSFGKYTDDHHAEQLRAMIDELHSRGWSGADAHGILTLLVETAYAALLTKAPQATGTSH